LSYSNVRNVSGVTTTRQGTRNNSRKKSSRKNIANFAGNTLCIKKPNKNKTRREEIKGGRNK
jgi:hypothetical protein